MITLLSPARFMLVVLRRWKILVATAVSFVALTCAVTSVITPKFVAQGALVLDVKSPDPIAGIVLPGMSVSTYMGTQVDIIRSEKVARKVVSELGLGADPDLKAKWHRVLKGQGIYEDWLMEELLDNLEVKPSRESNVLRVTFESSSPDFAAKVVNAFLSGYISTSLELRVDPAKQYRELFDGRSRQLRETLSRAQEKLSAFQQENRIIATDERLDIENTRLMELSTQLVALQALANESSSRRSAAEQDVEQLPEVVDSSAVNNFTNEIARLRSRLDELHQKYGEQHPQVKETLASIRSLEEQRAQASARIGKSIGVANNINQSRVQQVRQALEEQRQRVLALKSLRDQASVLERDVKNAQVAYDAVLERVSESSTETQLTQTNASILRSATPPLRQSSPKWLLNLAMATVIGVLVGVAVSVVREEGDLVIRREDDVALILGEQIIATLPSTRGSKSKVANSLPKLA